MENYIGMICPFCKTEIKENNNIKVCPTCNIPHHESCWEENKGCTTFGCSEQHYEAQGTNPTSVCSNCGSALGDSEDFCTKCGTPKTVENKNVCSKCGTELLDDQDFCPKCGQKSDLIVDSKVNSAINKFNEEINKTNEIQKKKPVKIAIIISAIITVILLGIIFIPKILESVAPEAVLSVEELCAKGNYEAAYEKADSDKKLEIRAENVTAVHSAISADMLKDPDSFQLRDAYYKEDSAENGTSKHLVLYISGANSYGAKVSSYWLYAWNVKEKEWEFFCSVSDLEDEEYSRYDDEDEKLEKLVNNLGRDTIKTTISDGIELDKAAIKRINKMFEEDILDEVKLLKVK